MIRPIRLLLTLPIAAASMALYAVSMRCDGTTRLPRVERVSGALAAVCAGVWR